MHVSNSSFFVEYVCDNEERLKTHQNSTLISILKVVLLVSLFLWRFMRGSKSGGGGGGVCVCVCGGGGGVGLEYYNAEGLLRCLASHPAFIFEHSSARFIYWV